MPTESNRGIVDARAGFTGVELGAHITRCDVVHFQAGIYAVSLPIRYQESPNLSNCAISH